MYKYFSNLKTFQGFTPLNMEKLYPANYNFVITDYYFRKYEWVWIYSFLFYLPICQILQGFYNPKYKNKLKEIGFVWNVCLSVFSLFGTYFTLPFLIKCLWSDGLDSVLLVDNPYCDYRIIPSVSFWSTLFVISKIPELGDTFLYVLKNGKQHIFLHWYHHLFTGVYSYFLVLKEDKPYRLGIWMVSLNFFVHSVMYGYYAVMEITERDSKIRKAVMNCASCLTGIQILQMIIVLFIIFYDWYVLENNFDHFGFGMYMVYALLFAKLFLEKYIKNKKE